MISDKHTQRDRKTDIHAHHNTPLRYYVNRSVCHEQHISLSSHMADPVSFVLSKGEFTAHKLD